MSFVEILVVAAVAGFAGGLAVFVAVELKRRWMLRRLGKQLEERFKQPGFANRWSVLRMPADKEEA